MIEARTSLVSTIAWALLRPRGDLRAGVRLLGFAVVGIASLVMIALATFGLVTLVGPELLASSLRAQMMLQSIALCGAFLVAHLIAGWVLDARIGQSPRRFGTLRGVGLGPPLRWIGEAAAGVAIGGALLGGAVALSALGGIRVAAGAPDLLDFGLWTTILVFAATFEELAFRGYGFVWTAAALGGLLAWLTVLIGIPRARLARAVATGLVLVGCALIFGIAHLSNHAADAISFTNTTLAGIWFGLVVVRTRTLSWACGMHLGWNHAQGLILGLPVSGLGSEGTGGPLPSLLVLTPLGPDWLTGGEYGPEASIAATAALLLAIGISAILPRRPDDQASVALVSPPADDAGSGSELAAAGSGSDADPSAAFGSSSAGR